MYIIPAFIQSNLPDQFANILSSRRTQLTIVGATFVVVNALCYFTMGERTLEDANHYIQAGKLLLETGQLDAYFHAFYVIPIALLALFTKMFGDPQQAFILFQIVLSALAVFALYRLVERIASPLAAFVCSMLYVLWLDNIRWNVLIMSESLFGSIVIFVLYALAQYRENFRFVVGVPLLVLAAVFTRPTGMLVCIAAGAFFVHRYAEVWQRSRYGAPGLTVLMGVLLVWTVSELSQTWDFTDQYFRGNVITYADTWPGDKEYMRLDPGSVDEINSTRSPFTRALLFVWHHPLHVVLVSTMKLFYLLSGVRPYYSVLHNIGVLLWTTVLYVGLVRGLRVMKSSPFKTSLLALMIGNCLLVMATTVDWDNRFYIPMEAGVVILASVGLCFWRREIGEQ